MNGTTDYPPEIQYIVDHYAQTIGSWFVGGVGDFVLQGAIVVMTAEYWARFKRDSRFLRAGVIVISIANVLKSIETAAILWHKLVEDFGDYDAAAGSTWYSIIEVLTAQIISASVQVFFSSRIWRLSIGFRIVLLPLALTILTALGGAVALTVSVYHAPRVNAQAAFQTMTVVQLSGNLASDAIITGLTSFYLFQSKTGVRRTDGLIYKLLRLTWLAALPPTICAILTLVAYLTLAPEGNSLFITFTFLAPKLYTISMLYTLNSRGTRLMNDTYVMSTHVVTGVDVSGEVYFTDRRGAHPMKTASGAVADADVLSGRMTATSTHDDEA
ncbi:hypothetical protein EXIGLDRAFT_831252 [Exidia glandulosa HHB12029]|uniref:DUF6534 domain-containing protein n=1 Tax=Exidia glandulosa HHB12029 TaxID=1314781 RepID=A0A165MSM0_EXIGL|nr:hypothetical protein EXIGLDRAFT_831252 [Exidia glandulosa HHB12029]